MNFGDFCELFQECMNNKEMHDDLLLQCFKVFDFDNKGYIDSKKIKNVFEIFKDKTSSDEI